MDLLIQDDSLWRELCLCHFTPQQIYRCRKETYRQSNVNWYKIYANLYRYFVNYISSIIMFLCVNVSVLTTSTANI